MQGEKSPEARAVVVCAVPPTTPASQVPGIEDKIHMKPNCGRWYILVLQCGVGMGKAPPHGKKEGEGKR